MYKFTQYGKAVTVPKKTKLKRQLGKVEVKFHVFQTSATDGW
jgi:hypothetical protein